MENSSLRAVGSSSGFLGCPWVGLGIFGICSVPQDIPISHKGTLEGQWQSGDTSKATPQSKVGPNWEEKSPFPWGGLGVKVSPSQGCPQPGVSPTRSVPKPGVSPSQGGPQPGGSPTRRCPQPGMSPSQGMSPTRGTGGGPAPPLAMATLPHPTWMEKKGKKSLSPFWGRFGGN